RRDVGDGAPVPVPVGSRLHATHAPGAHPERSPELRLRARRARAGPQWLSGQRAAAAGDGTLIGSVFGLSERLSPCSSTDTSLFFSPSCAVSEARIEHWP